jgi:hypothetical protein
MQLPQLRGVGGREPTTPSSPSVCNYHLPCDREADKGACDCRHMTQTENTHNSAGFKVADLMVGLTPSLATSTPPE